MSTKMIAIKKNGLPVISPLGDEGGLHVMSIKPSLSTSITSLGGPGTGMAIMIETNIATHITIAGRPEGICMYAQAI